MTTSKAAKTALAGIGAYLALPTLSRLVARQGPAAPVSPEGRAHRRLAVATWRAPREGRLMTKLELPVEAAQEYLDRHEIAGSRLTLTHVLGAAAAHAMREVPEANARVLMGNILPYPTIDVGFAVALGDSLAPAVVPSANALTIPELAATLKAATKQLRSGEATTYGRATAVLSKLPTALLPLAARGTELVMGGLGRSLLGHRGFPLGSVFISSVGMLGIDEVLLAPTPFARASVYISMGRVREVPVAQNGAVTAVKCVTVCLTGDHRIVDGVQSARFFAALSWAFAHPGEPDRLAKLPAPGSPYPVEPPTAGA